MSYINAFKIFLFVLMCWSALSLFVGGAKGMYQVYRENKKDKMIAILVITVLQVMVTMFCTLVIKFSCDFLVL